MNKADEFIREHTRICSNEFEPQKAPPSVYNPWLTPDQARRAVEIAREEMMENVCQFIQKHHHEYTSWNTEEYELEFNTEQFIQDIKQVMKDE